MPELRLDTDGSHKHQIKLLAAATSWSLISSSLKKLLSVVTVTLDVLPYLITCIWVIHHWSFIIIVFLLVIIFIPETLC